MVVDGWRLGWRLTGDGAVRLTFGPDAAYRFGLLAGGGVLVAFVLGLAWAARRRRVTHDPPALGTWAPPAWLLTGLAVVTGGLLAGWPGAGVGLLAVALGSVVSRTAPDAGPLVVAVLLLPAIVAYALRPWGADQGWAGSLGWPGYCVLVSCLLSLGWSGATGGPGSRQRAFSRIAGRSTSR